ncbi:hypothetical protein [Calothrix sp. CCY 0018]|uniref:hypothetical protein n=1 Tax=Calothrix sp. CCY 0018 TaxID=3103864 RepID=UPI0039C60422
MPVSQMLAIAILIMLAVALHYLNFSHIRFRYHRRQSGERLVVWQEKSSNLLGNHY